MSALSEPECKNKLLKDIGLNISVVVENKVEPSSNECWKHHKMFETSSSFYIKRYQRTSFVDWKNKNTVISKTLERGRKFKNEGYLCLDSIFTKCAKNTFAIKAKCSASMKKIKKGVVVTLTGKISRVEKIKCSCPAGASSYCNEIVDYSLKGLTEVPQEVFYIYTSQAWKWGITGKSDSFKKPIMSKVFCKDINKRGVNPTLYGQRNKFDTTDFSYKLETMEL